MFIDDLFNDSKKELTNENLRKWFKEKWVRFGPDGKIRGDCARGDESEGKPKCLPQAKAHALGKKGRKTAASRKRREDPNPERRGPAINVNTKESEAVAEGSEQKKMSVQNTLAYLKKIMGTESHEDWRNHIINTNEYFVLKDIPVNSLRSDLSGLDKANVEKYKQMDFSKAPPIVIGSDGNILDGYHRVNVAKALKVPTLKAWVGVKKQGMAEERLDELKCWPGYHRVKGTKAGFPGSCAKNKTNEEVSKKINPDAVRRIQQLLNTKFNANLDVDGILGPLTLASIKKFLPKSAEKQAPNPERTTAVQGKQVKEEKCPHCGGEMVSEELINEKKDACYYKVKSRYKVWPSAYASGALVQCRKKGANNWGSKKKNIEEANIAVREFNQQTIKEDCKRYYFHIGVSTSTQDLRNKFNLRHDINGWYLREGQENFKRSFRDAIKTFTIIKTR